MPKDSRAKRERMREAKRRARAAESDEARDARLARDRASHRRSRDKETLEMRAQRLERDRQCHKRTRDEEKLQMLAQRQERDLQSHKRVREEETSEQKEVSNARRHQELHPARLEKARNDASPHGTMRLSSSKGSFMVITGRCSARPDTTLLNFRRRFSTRYVTSRKRQKYTTRALQHPDNLRRGHARDSKKGRTQLMRHLHRYPDTIRVEQSSPLQQ